MSDEGSKRSSGPFIPPGARLLQLDLQRLSNGSFRKLGVSYLGSL